VVVHTAAVVVRGGVIHALAAVGGKDGDVFTYVIVVVAAAPDVADDDHVGVGSDTVYVVSYSVINSC